MLILEWNITIVILLSFCLIFYLVIKIMLIIETKLFLYTTQQTWSFFCLNCILNNIWNFISKADFAKWCSFSMKWKWTVTGGRQALKSLKTKFQVFWNHQRALWLTDQNLNLYLLKIVPQKACQMRSSFTSTAQERAA